ncbi:hypothetical protein L873DRAFT_1814549 [Choiromyces venosus 120613-1]|uniref:Uncharacterized protein n=1 Tax=Choiromyces venosus 120613-1 TaxID=1336337 RepID=A0A3N4J849_9PEZI|nr:hypothetical protein L873DRAFT_1814549 [Choiromyces venosus 120613-1]
MMRTYTCTGKWKPKQVKASQDTPTTTKYSLEPRVFHLEDSFIKVTEVGNQLSLAGWFCY